MKELDFLPDWYKAGRRRHSQVRKQYLALVAVFLLMMTFNLTATHRASRVAADVMHFEDQRMRAEAVVYEFNRLTKELNQLKTRADLVQRIDTGIDIAAVLAEISHVVGDPIVLSKVELVAEPWSPPGGNGKGRGTAVRVAGKATDASAQIALDKARLRIVLAGVAARAADVPDLVYRLEQSSYFQQIRLLSYGKTALQMDSEPAGPSPGKAPRATIAPAPDVTAFEITCYLANFRGATNNE